MDIASHQKLYGSRAYVLACIRHMQDMPEKRLGMVHPGRVSNVFLCPTNCDHDYMFPHSIITHRREYVEDGQRFREVTEFVVCRHCHHWIAGSYDCRCPFKCHEEPGGTLVVKRAIDAVD